MYTPRISIRLEIILGIILFVISLLFGLKVNVLGPEMVLLSDLFYDLFFNLDDIVGYFKLGNFWFLIVILSSSILVPYQIHVIKNLIIELNNFPKRLRFSTENHKCSSEMHLRVNYQLNRYIYYYLIFLAILIPFLIIKLNYFFDDILFYYKPGGPLLFLLFDLFGIIMNINMILFTSTILWIIICIFISIKMLTLDRFKDRIEMDIISSDNLGGLVHYNESIKSYKISSI
jgi:hypothetical protein